MIRKATVDDIPAIRQMASVVFGHTYSEILCPEQIAYMMEMMYSENSLRHQMEVDGTIFFVCDGKGYASLRYEGRTADGAGLFHLDKLYVMPSEQGKGLGSRLFRAAMNEAHSLSEGRNRIELNVNRHNRAVSFYEHLGMKKSRQGDFPIGEGYYMNDYIMSINF